MHVHLTTSDNGSGNTHLHNTPNISDKGALSTLIFGDAPDEDSGSDAEEEGTDWEPAVLEVGMTEADFSNKNLGPGDAIIISAWISHKDNGALTSINIKNKKNDIPDKKQEEIYQMVRMNKLNIALSDKSLTELDVSSIGFGAEGAKVVAQYASDNSVLAKLTFCDMQVVTMTTEITEANFSGKLRSYEARIVAAFLPKCT
jgi:hypothetical protein